MSLHYSFDFWNTVGKPNMEYARQRTALLARVFETDIATAKATYTATKGRLDKLAEDQGLSTPRMDCFAQLVTAFGRDPLISIDELATAFDTIFADLPPTVDPILVEALHDMHAHGITLSIGSNTNFINGQEIKRYVLDAPSIVLPFAFTIFSDEAKVSKPNPEFFSAILAGARDTNRGVTAPEHIIHVGDSKRCDGEGARDAGMGFLYVTDADNTAPVLASNMVDA